MRVIVWFSALTYICIFKKVTFESMDIKILGTGCQKCKAIEKATRDFVEHNGIDATVTKVDDIMEIKVVDGKVSVFPIFTVDGNVDNSTGNIRFVGKVVVKGRVPSDIEIAKFIMGH